MDLNRLWRIHVRPHGHRRDASQPRAVGGRRGWAPELSQSYSSREEAIDGGRTVADELGFTHVVEEAEPTGTITDPQE